MSIIQQSSEGESGRRERKPGWKFVIALVALGLVVPIAVFLSGEDTVQDDPWAYVGEHPAHTDHAALTLANESDPMGDGVADHVEKEFRSYLKCGILAHGFGRARCAGCGYEFLVALACYSWGYAENCVNGHGVGFEN